MCSIIATKGKIFNISQNDLAARANSVYHSNAHTIFFKLFPVSSSAGRRTEK